MVAVTNSFVQTQVSRERKPLAAQGFILIFAWRIPVTP
jgi:hypothetical protein